MKVTDIVNSLGWDILKEITKGNNYWNYAQLHNNYGLKLHTGSDTFGSLGKPLLIFQSKGFVENARSAAMLPGGIWCPGLTTKKQHCAVDSPPKWIRIWIRFFFLFFVGRTQPTKGLNIRTIFKTNHTTASSHALRKRNGTQESPAVIHVINLTVISKYSAGFSPCDKWISPYWSLNLKKKSRGSCNARIRLDKYIQIHTRFGRS